MTDTSNEPTARTPEEGAAPSREYTVGDITVEWRPERCIHSANCVRALPSVFNPRRRPWVDIEAADPEAVAAAVLRCPSGALTLSRRNPVESREATENLTE